MPEKTARTSAAKPSPFLYAHLRSSRTCLETEGKKEGVFTFTKAASCFCQQLSLGMAKDHLNVSSEFTQTFTAIKAGGIYDNCVRLLHVTCFNAASTSLISHLVMFDMFHKKRKSPVDVRLLVLYTTSFFVCFLKAL